MATSDLRTFIESRFRAFDASIDLEPGSPAQAQVIEPLLKRLGTDPFETDIESFLLDRLKQEFPDIYPADPSALRDLLIKPLILFLTPFKREIETIRTAQTLENPDLLSEGDVDALAANRFEDRPSGGFASGVARVFYPNPTNVQVLQSARFYTAGGKNFYPQTPMSITAEEMAFNRYNSLFYVDVVVIAESEGESYNIDVGDIVGVNGLPNALSATNTRKFGNGVSRLSNSDFINQVRGSLTEQSLVTRTGAAARLRKEFPAVKAVQVVGAEDEEMERDLLVAVTPGHAWITGQVNLYDQIALVRARTIEGDTSRSPSSGDTLYVYLGKSDFPALSQANRFVRLTVEELISGPLDMSSEGFQEAYLMRWSGTLPAGVTVTPSTALEGGFSRRAAVTVSSIAGETQSDLSVVSGEVHLLGRSDVYIRSDVTSGKAVLKDITAAKAVLERTSLTTAGGTGNANRVTDPTLADFVASGVVTGDLLVLEEGKDAGVYRILEVESGYLYLDRDLTETETDLRYRVVRDISIDLFEPKKMKFPFGDLVANDLSTSIGSRTFKLASTDLLSYGVVVGDTLRVKTGIDKGDYRVVGFDPVLGGGGVIVDREASSSAPGLEYEVFTALEKVDRPLVRVSSIQLLDSSGQTTGIKIPLARPLAVTPVGDFTSARVRASSLRRSGFVLPDMTGYTDGLNIASTPGGLYSLGFEPALGTYKKVVFADATQSEFLFREDAEGKCSYFLCTAEQVDDAENFPPIDPKPGECLTIKSGPNAGSYLIKNVHKFKYKDASGDAIWAYFVQIHGTFPVDVFRQLIEFLNASSDTSAHVDIITNQLSSTNFDSFFSSLLNSLGTKLDLALTSLGITSPGSSALQEAIEGLSQADYEWGDPARGVLRTYVQDPVLFEQKTGAADEVTLFELETDTGEVLRFRPDPVRYLKNEIVPARLASDASPFDYARDMESGGTTLEFSDSPTVFQNGIRAGDVLEFFEEIFFHGNTKSQQSAVITRQGSAEVEAPASSEGPFTADMVGNLFFLEEGDDAGGYRVTRFINSSKIVLDRALTVQTPTIVLSGHGANWGYDGSKNKLVAGSGSPFNGSHVGMWLTLYGIDSEFQGSYKIKSLISATTVELERSMGTFLPFPVDAGLGRWVVTSAPSSPPTVHGYSTELHGLRPFRMYEGQSQSTVINTVEKSSTLSKVWVDTAVLNGHKQPYRIYRQDVRRVTPAQIEENKDGPYFYFDTEVVSLSPSSSSNIGKGSYLTVKEGTYSALGYRLVPKDRTLTYSMKEECELVLPAQVLPTDNVDASDSLITVLGSKVQVLYEKAPTVAEVQSFLDEPMDRVTAADMLARHFLPGYVSYEASYSGSAKTADIAKDIIAAINSTPVENQIDVSELQRRIEQRGGNPRTPTKAMLVIHDWSRQSWLEMSEDAVGGRKITSRFDGTSRIVHYLSGQDASGKDPLPDGERINLVRE